MRPFPYGIIGIGGYGAAHVGAIEALEKEGLAGLRAVAEAFPDRCRERLEGLRARGVHVYADYREMLREERELEVVSVPTPIPLHVPMALACFERGVHVMLEKPPAVLVQDVDRMLAAAERAGRLCQVGFQNVADGAARLLKARIARGDLGAVRELVVVGLWRRLDGYYTRASWAGKLRLGDAWVLDGPLNNPLCHYIHQALFLACAREHDTLRPLAVRAELHRAHLIEGEDIVCARAELEGGVTMHTYLSLCAPESSAARVEIVGDKGRAAWQAGRYEWEADGRRSEVTGPAGGAIDIIRNFLRALDGEEPQWSPLSATRNVILHNNGCYRSAGVVRPLPSGVVRRSVSPREAEKGDTETEVDGLDELMGRAARERRLFSELGVAWAAETPTVRLDFDSFDPSPLLEGS